MTNSKGTIARDLGSKLLFFYVEKISMKMYHHFMIIVSRKNFYRFISVIFLMVKFWSQPGIADAQTSIDNTFHLIEVIYQFERFVEDTMQKGQLPGLAVAIVKDNRIIYLNGFGVREIGRSDPIDIHTIFRLASVSKGFAGVLTGILVDQNKLNWDDRVCKYLPNFSLNDSRNTKNLTIRHLLNHTTGLPQHTFTDLVEDNMPFEEIVSRLNTVPVIAPVGKIYSYQNVVYSLIGEVVKSATGSDYKTLVTELIFESLDMTDASLGKEAFLSSANRALPHVRRNGGWATLEAKETYYNVLPAAGVNASIYDMAQWLRALMGGASDVISPYTIQEVTMPSIKTPRERWKHRWHEQVRDASYGLGWRIYDYAGHKLVYHGGWIQGYRAEVGFMPDQKIGIAVLMNFESLVAIEFLPTFFDLYLNLSGNDSLGAAN